MWRAAFRRFATVVGMLVGVTVLVSLGFGLVAGASPLRSISLGLVLIGCVVVLIGFITGNRGPLRIERSVTTDAVRTRVAGRNERDESINTSALFVGVGLLLLIVGIALDPRYSLL